MTASWPSLRRANPVAKLAATLPAIVLMFLTKDPWVPSLALLVCLTVLALFGRVHARMLATCAAGVALASAVLTVSFGWMVQSDGPAVLHAGFITLSHGQLHAGASTALRLCATAMLAMVCGLTTSSQQMLASLQCQLRIPYRHVYAAGTGFALAPRMAASAHTIQLAHRARGTVAARGPVGWVQRQVAVFVPLVAGGIRHTERMAMSMDSRAFGAHPRRTERVVTVWRPSDLAVMAAGWVLTAAVFAAVAHAGLLAPLRLW